MNKQDSRSSGQSSPGPGGLIHPSPPVVRAAPAGTNAKSEIRRPSRSRLPANLPTSRPVGSLSRPIGRARRWSLVRGRAALLAAATGAQLLGGMPSLRATAILPRSLRRVPEQPSGALPWPYPRGDRARDSHVPSRRSYLVTASRHHHPGRRRSSCSLTIPPPLDSRSNHTVTAADAAQYAADQAAPDSDVLLTANGQLTEPQAIEAILVPSAITWLDSASVGA